MHSGFSENRPFAFFRACRAPRSTFSSAETRRISVGVDAPSTLRRLPTARFDLRVRFLPSLSLENTTALKSNKIRSVLVSLLISKNNVEGYK